MLRRLLSPALPLIVAALFAILPSGCSGRVAAQDARVTIVGSVVDAALSPLAGVLVTLEREQRVQGQTLTDSEGKFRFSGIAPGAYRVRAELQGFPVFARDLVVPGDVTTLQLPIVLSATEKQASELVDRDERARVRSGSAPAPPPSPVAQGAAASGRGGASSDTVNRAPNGAANEVSVLAQGGQRWSAVPPASDWLDPAIPPSGERYAHVRPGQFHSTGADPLSTFGADVDTASYANVRRFLSRGQQPPPDAVRIEELINYFRFDYALPDGRQPFALTTEIGDCPWAPSHKLVLVGARAKTPARREIKGRNLVLLLDVSGSMATPDKLPLIQTALGLFVDTLAADDRLAIVTYAGTSGVALPSTPVRRRDVIQRAIAGLSAGGSTNGAQGLLLAYRAAREAFIPGGVNRVILATDGDFNVGVTSQHDLLRLIERERESGVFLSVFGVGTGNLKDATMEMLADRGNGHYAYLDSLQEARRVLIREADATLDVVAKDVKFQVEFNPAVVSAWKLIGYENRTMAAPDFNNDRKDGGEMGAGHTVTVLYEVVPVGAEEPALRDGAEDRPTVDPLRYQDSPAVVRPAPRATPSVASRVAVRTDEWLTVKARYKAPEGEVSQVIAQPVRVGGRVRYLPFAAAVAEFGLLLRDDTREMRRWDALSRRVKAVTVPASLAADKDGFEEMVEIARGLARLR